MQRPNFKLDAMVKPARASCQRANGYDPASALITTSSIPGGGSVACNV